jgi:hypothetical protein
MCIIGANLWLIYLPWHFPFQFDNSIQGASKKAEKEFLRLYPTVYAYMLNYKEPLSKRNQMETGIRYEWYAMQRWGANYWEDFDKPKIVWARLMRLSKSDVDSFPRFAKAKAGTFVVDSLCFFSGKDSDLLCHLLNSTYAAYYFFRNIAILDNGGMQMRQQYVENIPLPLCLKGMTVCNDKDIYKCFNFSNSEIDFINWFVKKRKEEILS